jgi:hypothetical protein
MALWVLWVFWAYVNSSRVFKHLLPLYHDSKGINPCSYDLFKSRIHDKIRWEELGTKQSQSSDQHCHKTDTYIKTWRILLVVSRIMSILLKHKWRNLGTMLKVV